MSSDFNIEEKRQELRKLWEDSFELCRLFVDQAKAGDLKLTASMLKELNTFLRSSVDILDGFAQEEARRQIEATAPLEGLDALEHAAQHMDLSVPETYRD